MVRPNYHRIPCSTCFGYGMRVWAVDQPILFQEIHRGDRTIPCPECGANKNPVDRNLDQPIFDDEIEV